MTITTEEAERLAKWCSVGLPIIATALRSLAAERDALKAENARLRRLVQALVENDPDDMARDGQGGRERGSQ